MDQNAAQIPFPQTFYLKVIFETAIPEEQREVELHQVFEKNSVPYDDITIKNSAKGNFISYSIRVLIINQAQMQEVYADIKKIKGVKVAM